MLAVLLAVSLTLVAGPAALAHSANTANRRFEADAVAEGYPAREPGEDWNTYATRIERLRVEVAKFAVAAA